MFAARQMIVTPIPVENKQRKQAHCCFPAPLIQSECLSASSVIHDILTSYQPPEDQVHLSILID